MPPFLEYLAPGSHAYINFYSTHRPPHASFGDSKYGQEFRRIHLGRLLRYLGNVLAAACMG